MKSVVHKFTPSKEKVKSHFNRIYSVLFDPNDDNIMYSGGWDNLILKYDIREEYPVGKIYGPHICGKSIDIFEYTMLTGSYRSENSLELWDTRTLEKVDTIDWDGVGESGGGQVITSKIGRQAKPTVVAGGAGNNELKIFDMNKGNAIASVSGNQSAVVSLDVSKDGEVIAFGTINGVLNVVDFQTK